MKCCFIGHRKINITKEQGQNLKDIIENLIINNDVSNFLFGSKSEFDYLCHSIVSELKQNYPNIKRIKYTCQSESCLFETEKVKREKLYSQVQIQEVCLLCYEKEVEHKTKYTAGKASYIERNKAMIDDSDYCIFYYDENYKPPTRKHKKVTPPTINQSQARHLVLIMQNKKGNVLSIYLINKYKNEPLK